MIAHYPTMGEYFGSYQNMGAFFSSVSLTLFLWVCAMAWCWERAENAIGYQRGDL